MSSYVIDKKEYIKVAGVVAALNKKELFCGHKEGLYIGYYSYNEYGDITGWSLHNEESLKDLFSRFHRLNALSVQEQYHDKEAYYDFENYETDFNKYYEITKKCIFNKDLEQLGYLLCSFKSSVSYQIENRKYNKEIVSFLNDVIVRLFDLIRDMKHPQLVAWGKFEYITAEQEKEMEKEAFDNYYMSNCD